MPDELKRFDPVADQRAALAASMGSFRRVLEGWMPPAFNVPSLAPTILAAWMPPAFNIPSLAPTILAAWKPRAFNVPVPVPGMLAGWKPPTFNFDQWASIGEPLRRLIEKQQTELTEQFRRVTRSWLPPNLRDMEDIGLAAVLDFVEEAAIPLYLIPSGPVARRLLRAPDHAARRKVLNDCQAHIIEDCEDGLAKVTSPQLADAVALLLDGIGALKDGHPASAQAVFTVALDGLIQKFYPARRDRQLRTNRPQGSTGTPDFLEEARLREVFVWMPIYNAHTTFWSEKGDSEVFSPGSSHVGSDHEG